MNSEKMPAKRDAIVTRLKRMLVFQKIKRVYRKTKQRNPEEFMKYQRVLEAYHRGGGYQRDMQDLKLFDINRILNQAKPKRILELGSGCSSYVFTEYAHANQVEYSVVEESQHWLENTQLILNDLLDFEIQKQENLHFVLGERVLDENSDPPESYFKQLPDETCDFVFIDGPTLKKDGVQYLHFINTDIFHLAERELPKTIVVDIRKSTVREIQKRIGAAYECQESDLFDIETRRPGTLVNHFTIFTRKN